MGQVEHRSILGNFKQLYSFLRNFKQLYSILRNFKQLHFNLVIYKRFIQICIQLL